jgi:hypothetical protein
MGIDIRFSRSVTTSLGGGMPPEADVRSLVLTQTLLAFADNA